MTISTVIKKLFLATAGATCLALTTLGAGKAQAAVIVLDFEGVGDFNRVGNFYNTAPQDFDITFSPSALALIDSDAGGSVNSGNFGGEPSPSTVLSFLGTLPLTLNAPNGFDTGFSFFYSTFSNSGFVNVYDGLNATGNLLATINLPSTPFNGAPDPSGVFSPLVPIGVSFSGIARSVDFGGIVLPIVFDDITLGSATPGGGSQSTPEPASLLGLLGLAVFGCNTMLNRRQQKASAKA